MKKEQILQALERFQAHLERRGYRKPERLELVTTLAKQLGMTRSQVKYLAGVDGELVASSAANADNVQFVEPSQP